MAKAKSYRLEAAGWGFWLVTVLLLAGPCVYGAFRLTQAHLSREIPVMIGLIGATLFASIITFVANSVIQRGNARRKTAGRNQGGPAKNTKS